MTPQSPVPQQITALMPKTPTPGIPGTELNKTTIGQMKDSMDFNALRNTVFASNGGGVGRTSESAYWRFGVGYDDLQHLVLSMESRTDSNGNRWVNQGDFVKVLQKMLKARGYLESSVDGQFGEDTYNAVLNFQKDMKKYYDWLTPDGIVGNGIWAILWLPEPGSDRYNAMLDDQTWFPSFGQYRNENDIIGAAGLNGYSQFKDTSQVPTGAGSYEIKEGTAGGEIPAESFLPIGLYDPSTDNIYSPEMQLILIQDSNKWFEAKTDKERTKILNGIIHFKEFLNSETGRKIDSFYKSGIYKGIEEFDDAANEFFMATTSYEVFPMEPVMAEKALAEEIKVFDKSKMIYLEVDLQRFGGGLENAIKAGNPGSPQWKAAVKAIKEGTGKGNNIIVKTQADAERLLRESGRNLEMKSIYSSTPYKSGYEVHPSEPNVGNNLSHIKWKDWSNGKSSGADGHIFFGGD